MFSTFSGAHCQETYPMRVATFLSAEDGETLCCLDAVKLSQLSYFQTVYLCQFCIGYSHIGFWFKIVFNSIQDMFIWACFAESANPSSGVRVLVAKSCFTTAGTVVLECATLKNNSVLIYNFELSHILLVTLFSTCMKVLVFQRLAK